jgi:hypothetical protein
MTGWWSSFAKLGRVSGGPLAVRVVTWFAGWIALLIAAPEQVMDLRFILGAAVLAALPAVMPGSGLVLVVLLAALAGWLVDTLALGTPVTYGRLFGLSVTLYLVHAGAALSAVLPYDAVVDRQALVRWATRTILMLAVSGGVTLMMIWALPRMPEAGAEVSMAGGLALVIALVALLHRLAKR